MSISHYGPAAGTTEAAKEVQQVTPVSLWVTVVVDATNPEHIAVPRHITYELFSVAKGPPGTTNSWLLINPGTALQKWEPWNHGAQIHGLGPLFAKKLSGL
jgi:hypothetical protein